MATVSTKTHKFSGLLVLFFLGQHGRFGGQKDEQVTRWHTS